MRKTTVAAFVFGSSTALAMNGLRPIGVSAESNALGGTGVTNFYNYYDALYKNPAMMSFTPLQTGQTQAVFGTTYGSFEPRVKATYGEDQEYKRPINQTSGAFPSSLGFGRKLSRQASMAFGVYGGGGGADYGEGADSVYRAKSKTTSYTATAGASWDFGEGTSVGINGNVSQVDTRASNLSVTKGTMTETGGSAMVYGALVGVSQQISNFTIGAIVQPAQTALIEQARDIDGDGTRNDLLFTAVPNEFAAGVTWRHDAWMVEADYRFLQWSEAEFLKSVGWQDQHVLALGQEYGRDHRLRLGANISTAAVTSRSGTDGYSTATVSGRQMINLAGDAFAVTSGLGVNNRHYTLGSSHVLTSAMKVNTAFVYMEPGSLERSGYYMVPTGKKQYGWKSRFGGSSLQVDMTYIW